MIKVLYKAWGDEVALGVAVSVSVSPWKAIILVIQSMSIL